MIKKSAFLFSAIALAGCAYATDGAIQDVKFITPGAHGAKCDVYVEKLRYRASPPQTLTLYKTDQDLVVDCRAPGNRHKIIYITPTIEDSAKGNIWNLGVGLPVDYASKSMYRYPDVIEVNFTDTPVRSQPLPAQNNPDVRQPEDYPLEEFSPSVPRMNKDGNAVPIQIERRNLGNSPVIYDDSAAAFSEDTPTVGGGKGDINSVINSLSSAINPSSAAGVPNAVQAPASTSSSNADAPIPLIPGE